MRKVAIIVAHPDDEVLGCGGSIARLTREGAAIHIMILATGLTSRGPANQKAIVRCKLKREEAATALGAQVLSSVIFLIILWIHTHYWKL